MSGFSVNCRCQASITWISLVRREITFGPRVAQGLRKKMMGGLPAFDLNSGLFTKFGDTEDQSMLPLNFLIHTTPENRIQLRRLEESEIMSVNDPRAMIWIEHLRSANWHQAAVLCFCAYLLGCFTAGYYLVRYCTGKDVREIGSGSVGAKNTGRILGGGGFLITLLFDFGKGSLAVLAARHFNSDGSLIAMVMLAVVAGHVWPAQLRFHGGKGMATSLGCLVVCDPHLALAFAALFLCLLVLMRKTVLPGLLALAGVPLAGELFGHNSAEIVQLSFLAALVLFAHRKNIFEEIAQLLPRRHAEAKPNHSRP
jgi:glycerol-3-phosphate acyltransferase PlsY